MGNPDASGRSRIALIVVITLLAAGTAVAAAAAIALVARWGFWGLLMGGYAAPLLLALPALAFMAVTDRSRRGPAATPSVVEAPSPVATPPSERRSA